MARLPETGRKWAEITPNDSANIPGGIPDAILVGAAGDVRMMGEDGNVETLPLGEGIQPLSPTRVYATGTTATGLFAIYGGA